MKFNYNRIYEIGIWEFYIENLKVDYWLKQIYQLKLKDNKGVIISNENGYQSKSNLHEHSSFLPLVNNINSLIPPDLKVNEMWGNISQPNSFNWPHKHGSISHSALSGVLYLKVPKNSGQILFHHPADADFTFPNMTSYKEKHLILFPNFLVHSVLPNKSNEDRISIAFNTGRKSLAPQE